MRIALCPLPGQPGHRNPMLALAKRWRAAGHDVTFLGVADDRRAVGAEGFRTIVFGESPFPEGSFAHRREQARKKRSFLRDAVGMVRRVRRLIDEVFESLPRLRNECFDLVTIDAHWQVSAVIALALDRPACYLHTNLELFHRFPPPITSPEVPGPSGQLSLRGKLLSRFRALHLHRTLNPRGLIGAPMFRLAGIHEQQILTRFVGPHGVRRLRDTERTFPGLVACPAAFDFPDRSAPDLFYLDALVDRGRIEEPFDWSAVPAGARVVYVSIGTQGWRMKRLSSFLSTVIKAVGSEPDFHVVLSTGGSAKLERTAGLPPNVHVFERVSQLRVLQRADVMVTHAGLGTVKECILAGVPMVAFPIDTDQPGNAARISYHGLGERGDYLTATPHDVRRMLRTVLSSRPMRERVRAMGQRFREAEQRNECIDVVERIANGWVSRSR